MNGSLIVQNPVSLIGAAKRVLPYGSRGHGWWAVLTWTGAIVVLLLWWAVVIAWYGVMTFGFLLLWIPWGFWTLGRRHHVHDRLRAAMAQDTPTRSIAG